MPTFEDAVADGDEARQALRGLAYATRQLAKLDDTYLVIGDVLDGLRSRSSGSSQMRV